MKCIHQHKYFPFGFESHSCHRCLSVFILSCVWIGPCNGLIPRPRGPTDFLYGSQFSNELINSESEQARDPTLLRQKKNAKYAKSQGTQLRNVCSPLEHTILQNVKTCHPPLSLLETRGFPSSNGSRYSTFAKESVRTCLLIPSLSMYQYLIVRKLLTRFSWKLIPVLLLLVNTFHFLLKLRIIRKVLTGEVIAYFRNGLHRKTSLQHFSLVAGTSLLSHCVATVDPQTILWQCTFYSSVFACIRCRCLGTDGEDT
jgi:hypothetical protein